MQRKSVTPKNETDVSHCFQCDTRRKREEKERGKMAD